jgi:hypothetical protein
MASDDDVQEVMVVQTAREPIRISRAQALYTTARQRNRAISFGSNCSLRFSPPLPSTDALTIRHCPLLCEATLELTLGAPVVPGQLS